MDDKMEWNNTPNHPKTIIHIDIDCFYVQVELLKNPHLQNEAVGVKQKNIVVTCNYVARRQGVKKCMLISDALKNCPNLILFNGEDLYKYRQASNQIHSLLTSFSAQVEKSGFDENYLDVSELVDEREKKNEDLQDIAGHCVGDSSNQCICGCHKRLTIGSQIAFEIRRKIKYDLGFTSCCGVSYNKLLAKLSCSTHKPNQQTVLFPNGTIEFLLDLNEVEKIPGIGPKTKNALAAIGVKTVKDLQAVDLKILKKALGNDEAAINFKNLSFGICNSLVKQSGKPNTIGLEDGFRKICVEGDVKEKFRMLLLRLMTLVEEDGRIPMTVKVTVRKYDSIRKIGHRETKHSPVPVCIFRHPVGKLSEESTNKLLNIVMSLFCKIVNISKPFHVTLLGLAFSRFHEKGSNRSIASFLLKKRDLSVQSLTSFVSNETSPELVEVSVPCCSRSDSESEAEPSPKKTKLDIFIKRNKLTDDDSDTCSPNKLDVKNLNLNEDAEISGECPNNIDPSVFRELPYDLRQEIIREWKFTYGKSKPNQNKQSLILKYCISNK